MYWIRSLRCWGLKVTLKNMRFQLGYRIGGFTSAHNYTDEELRTGEAEQLIESLRSYVPPVKGNFFDQECAPTHVSMRERAPKPAL